MTCAVKPDVEIATYTVDVGFRNPIGAGVFRIRMAQGDVDTGFSRLQNVSDNVSAGAIEPMANSPTRLLFSSCWCRLKIITQIFVIGTRR